MNKGFNSKFNAKKTIVNGIKFDSKLEANIYKRMLELELDPELQVKYVLQEAFVLNGKKIREIYYKCDFLLVIDRKVYVIDAKGMKLPEFKLKEKLFNYRYKKEIICIGSVKQFNEWYEGVKNE